MGDVLTNISHLLSSEGTSIFDFFSERLCYDSSAKVEWFWSYIFAVAYFALVVVLFHHSHIYFTCTKEVFLGLCGVNLGFSLQFTIYRISQLYLFTSIFL